MPEGNPEAVPETGFMFSRKWYTKLKWTTTVVLPALSTLYFTIGTIWGLPAITEVVGTIAALSLFLGSLIGISTKSYTNSDARFVGDIVTEIDPTGFRNTRLELNADPHTIEELGEATFKVLPPVQVDRALGPPPAE